MAPRVAVFAMEVRPALTRLGNVLAGKIWHGYSQDTQAHADKQAYPLFHIHCVTGNDPPWNNSEYDVRKARPR